MAGIRVIEYWCLVLALFFAALPGLAFDRGMLDGIWPDSASGAELLAAEGRCGYSCMLIEYGAADGGRIPALLLVPDSVALCPGNGLPAVLMLHDHGARFDIGKEKLAKPVAGSVPEHILKSSRQWVGKIFDGVYFADSLASLGYVVLVPDALYWGGRSSADAQHWSELVFGDSAKSSGTVLKALKNNVYEGQRAVYDSLKTHGDVWARRILHDDISALDFLKSLPYVDHGKIGAFGFSMGAHRCWLLSAVSNDIRCGAAVSWMTLKEAADTTSASSLSMVIPELRSVYDFPDVAAMLYPRPMLFLSGEDDHLFPKDVVSEAYRRMNGIYDFLSAFGPVDSELRTEFFSGGHNCGKQVQALVVDFFRMNL